MIETHCPKVSKKGRLPPYATILRIRLLQQWYSLSYPAVAVDLIETPTMRRFAAVELINDRIPDKHQLIQREGLNTSGRVVTQGGRSVS